MLEDPKASLESLRFFTCPCFLFCFYKEKCIVNNYSKNMISARLMVGNHVKIEGTHYDFWGLPFPVLCSIGFCACKWSAKAKIPVFPPGAVSLQRNPPLPETPPLDSFIHFTCYTSSDLHKLDII